MTDNKQCQKRLTDKLKKIISLYKQTKIFDNLTIIFDEDLMKNTLFKKDILILCKIFIIEYLQKAFEKGGTEKLIY